MSSSQWELWPALFVRYCCPPLVAHEMTVSHMATSVIWRCATCFKDWIKQWVMVVTIGTNISLYRVMYVKAGLISCILLTLYSLSTMHPVSRLNCGCKCLVVSTIAQNWCCGQFVVFCARSLYSTLAIVPTFWAEKLIDLYFCYLLS